MLKKITGAVCLTLTLALAFSAFGQKNDNNSEISEVKSLKKFLKKNSNYQWYDQRISFSPIEFEGCNVEYKFKAIESIGSGTATSSNLISSQLESYDRVRNLQPRTRDVVTSSDGQSVTVLGAKRNEIIVIENEKVNSRETKVVKFNLGQIEKDSIQIVDNAAGSFLSFQVSKTIEGEKVTVNEAFPIESKKKAKKASELLVEAFGQCK